MTSDRHGGVVIVLGDRAMCGDGVRDLHGSFATEFRIVGQHPPEHGDIGSRVSRAQQLGGLRLDGFPPARARSASARAAVCSSGETKASCSMKVGSLSSSLQILPKDTGDLASHLQGFVILHLAVEQMIVNYFPRRCVRCAR